MKCLFRTHIGVCGRESQTERCPKHVGKSEKPKRDLIGKTRGKSDWYPESGLNVKGGR